MWPGMWPGMWLGTKKLKKYLGNRGHTRTNTRVSAASTCKGRKKLRAARKKQGEQRSCAEIRGFGDKKTFFFERN